MNVLGGFDTGFSFFYTAISQPGSVNVFSGLDATGSLLATINLSLTNTNCSGDPTGQFCNFKPVGVGFAGTAFSVNFGGVANQIGIDNVTLGSARPTGEVPEPPSVMLLGTGLAASLVVLRIARLNISSLPEHGAD